MNNYASGNKQKNLWLDDYRDYPEGFHCVRSYEDFVEYINKYGVPPLISFDHDLGACSECKSKGLHIGDMLTPETTFMNYCEHAKTGYDCALWLIENDLKINDYFCHSANPIGRKRINDLLSDWKKGIKPKKLEWEKP